MTRLTALVRVDAERFSQRESTLSAYNLTKDHVEHNLTSGCKSSEEAGDEKNCVGTKMPHCAFHSFSIPNNQWRGSFHGRNAATSIEHESCCSSAVKILKFQKRRCSLSLWSLQSVIPNDHGPYSFCSLARSQARANNFFGKRLSDS